MALPEYLADLDPWDLYQDALDLARDALPTVTAWQPGEPARALFSVVSRGFATAMNSTVIRVLRARFWEEAPDDDALALEIWTSTGVLAKKSGFAGGTLLAENRAGGVYTPIQPGQVRVQNTNGKTFTNINTGNLMAWPGTGPYPTVPLQFRADDPGSGSNTPVGAIVPVPVTAPGAGVQVQTNTTEWIGQDRQSKESLIADAKAAPSLAAVAGPVRAYEFVAQRTRRQDGTDPDRLFVEKESDVAVAVSRVGIENLGGGRLRLWLASATGPAQGTSVLVGSDVWLVARALQRHVIPTGFSVQVAAAVAVTPGYSFILILDPAAKVETSIAIARSLAALQAWQRTFPVGGRLVELNRYVPLDEVRRTAALWVQADGTFKPAPGVLEVVVIAGADVPMQSFQVLVGTYSVSLG